MPAPGSAAGRPAVVGLAAYRAEVPNDLHLVHITCGGCTAEWAGADRAHCPTCHVTFDSPVLYDGHREGGRCLLPRTLGLVATKNGIWGRRAAG
jgi:hypothetical protein